MSVYVIGDVQGCYDSLQKLLSTIAFKPSQDQLIFAGDMVNRGPKSLETLRFIQSLGESAQCVLGNHDLYLLMCAVGGRSVRAKDTFVDILMAPSAQSLLNYLVRCPLMLQVQGFTIVHAGLLPQWTVEQALVLANDFSQAMKQAWDTSTDAAKQFFQSIWNDEPNAWDESLTPPERWRVSVNGMTRMRMLDHKNRMNFSLKGALSDMPDGFVPWFNAKGRRSQGSPIVCGHWSAIGLLLSDEVSHIDTGCAWGRSLTAMRLPDRALFQVQAVD